MESLFAHPALAAAGAAAISIPILIHLLSRLRRTPVYWAAMRFLREAFRRHKQRLRLEQLLLLLVRCLILLMLGLALAGPLLGGIARGLARGQESRVICIVLDDALTTQADAGGRSRFDQLRDTAMSILEGLHPGDRVGLWRAAAPPQVLISPSEPDLAAARQALLSIKPRYSRADLAGSLQLVAQAVNDAALVRPGEKVKLVVLSDFSASSLNLEQPLAALAPLQQRAEIWATRPQPAVTNVQISHFAPRRRMVLATGGAASVAVELRLQRFAVEMSESEAPTRAAMRVIDSANGRVLGAVTREHRWAAGQNEATLNAQIPLEMPADAGKGAAGRILAMEATLDGANVPATPGMSDALEADNQRFSTMEWRQRLMVGLVDDPSDVAADGQFAPRDWLTLALTPRSNSAGAAEPVELVTLNAAQLDAAAVASLDAALVVRPDRLTDRGIAALAVLAQRGGLVWIFPPRAATPAAWAPTLAEQLKLPIHIDINFAEAKPPEGAGTDAGVTLPGVWPLAADRAPEALSLLGADWEALLRPVRVARTLQISGADPSSAWLTLAGPKRMPWLIVQSHGRGAIAWLGSAIDPDWSNLPTRPLFVPLLHETLRNVLGSQTAPDALSGEQPVLDVRWRAAQRLERIATPGPESAGAGSGGAVGLIHDDNGSRPANPLSRPGIYLAQPPTQGLQLAVNVDPAAGDTRALDAAQVAAHLGAKWLDPAEPRAMLAEQSQRANLGWPLLWALLALVLLETAMARWFSHALRASRGLRLPLPGGSPP